MEQAAKIKLDVSSTSTVDDVKFAPMLPLTVVNVALRSKNDAKVRSDTFDDTSKMNRIQLGLRHVTLLDSNR